MSNAVKPYEKDGDLHLTDCDSTDGFWTANGTEVYVQDENGRKSIHMRNFTSYKDHPAGVGAMAFLDFDPGCAADISAYNKLHFSLWSSFDYANDDERGIDVFQLNLVTRTDDGAGIEQDGYNIIINAWNIKRAGTTVLSTLKSLLPRWKRPTKPKFTVCALPGSTIQTATVWSSTSTTFIATRLPTRRCFAPAKRTPRTSLTFAETPIPRPTEPSPSTAKPPAAPSPKRKSRQLLLCKGGQKLRRRRLYKKL